MGVVDVRPCIVPPRQRDEIGERGNVAVHGEHAIRHDQRAPVLRSVHGEQPLEGRRVGVRIDVNRRAARPRAVDQRRVIERVGEDRVPPACERRDDAYVRRVAGRERERALDVEEGGELALERRVLRVRPDDEPRRGRPCSVGANRSNRCLRQARIGRQAEVIVRREVHADAARRLEQRAAATGYTAELAHEALEAQFVELRGEDHIE